MTWSANCQLKSNFLKDIYFKLSSYLSQRLSWWQLELSTYMLWGDCMAFPVDLQHIGNVPFLIFSWILILFWYILINVTFHIKFKTRTSCAMNEDFSCDEKSTVDLCSNISTFFRWICSREINSFTHYSNLVRIW